ncbi:hypothetical protein Trydic_g19130 [Trypoxylus dichotomus]
MRVDLVEHFNIHWVELNKSICATGPDHPVASEIAHMYITYRLGIETMTKISGTASSPLQGYEEVYKMWLSLIGREKLQSMVAKVVHD